MDLIHHPEKITMTFSNWLRALINPANKKVKHPARRRFRPVVEMLEDRTAPATFSVTSAVDAGAGTLRQAILSANSAAGADIITIDLGAGLHTINLVSALPAITGAVTIDGSQSGLPKLQLNGTVAGAGANGLVIKASGTTIRGLIINRFAGNGIVITNNVVGGVIVPTSNCVVEGCFIGTDSIGAGAAPNGLSGVAINGTATANRIGGTATNARNILSGNLKNGVVISGPAATGNLVVGNLIGLSNAAGSPVLANGQDGVLISGAKNNRIGGTTTQEGNVVSGNARAGVTIVGLGATGNLVQGNIIGLNAATTARPNLLGVWVAAGATGNTIGGASLGDANTISGNTSAGVAFTGAGTASNVLSKNKIGTASDGASTRPNGLDGVRIMAGAKSITVKGNVISGNGANGVFISGAGVTGNVVKGNVIGLNAAGTAGLGNTLNGVRIGEGAASNTIGGTAASDRNVISGNTEDGVLITGAGATGNKLQGNYIGLDAAGAADLGNDGSGVEITKGAASNTVGGTAAGARNVISGNTLDGVSILSGASGNLVLGNILGLDAAGSLQRGNGEHGIAISFAANNTIGGTSAAARNVISANGSDGISCFGATGNKIQGNFIGTDLIGALDRGNSGAGVLILGPAVNNTVGGAVAGARNVISGNGKSGLTLNATSNLVQGNFIGLDATGAADLGNGEDGIAILAGAANNQVGGTSALARNVISGNGGNGILLHGSFTSGNKVLGNFIGLDAAGAADLGNDGDGVEISGGAHDNTLGGTVAAARNIISGNGANGVFINQAGTTGNKVLGNFIGLNATGAADLGNTGDGVRVSSGAANNTVGGTVAGARNVISGNGGDGIRIKDAGTDGNKVQGNFIGLNAAGAAAIGNDFGVEIDTGAANNTVGGAIAGARNVISGNSGDGVLISGAGTTGNKVQGNFIGTDVTGAADLGNEFSGVFIFGGAADNTVGGAVAGVRNVISGNGFSGATIVDAGTTGNQIQGNFIGLNAAGTADLGNDSNGVDISVGAADNTVGGTTPLARNVISGNAENGVFIVSSGTNANKIQGNFIGLAANGIAPLGNGENGVFIAAAAASNSIGGSEAGAGNIIAHNGGDGVLIGSSGGFAAAGNGNSVLGNSIFANGESGIDLGADDGVTANDASDIDSGPNDLLNRPVLTGAFLVGDVLLIGGTLNTELGKTLLIELFSTPTLNAAGQAEGKTFLGFVLVTTSASNTVGFSTFLQTTKAKLGDLITATATDQLGNTSEFSLSVTIV
jgi:hypothetical protein